MTKIFKTAAIGVATTLVAAAMALIASPASAASDVDTERNRALISKGLSAWADGTGSPYDLLATNVSWTIAGNSVASKTYPNKEAFLSEVIRPFNARMRDRLIPTVHRLYADGDTVIAHFDAKGTSLDGKPYLNSYAWILRMKDEQIVEAFAFFDAIAFDDLWKRVSPPPAP